MLANQVAGTTSIRDIVVVEIQSVSAHIDPMSATYDSLTT